MLNILASNEPMSSCSPVWANEWIRVDVDGEYFSWQAYKITNALLAVYFNTFKIMKSIIKQNKLCTLSNGKQTYHRTKRKEK